MGTQTTNLGRNRFRDKSETKYIKHDHFKRCVKCGKRIPEELWGVPPYEYCCSKECYEKRFVPGPAPKFDKIFGVKKTKISDFVGEIEQNNKKFKR